MSTIETLRQQAAQQSAERLEHLAQQIEQVRQSRAQSVEDLAQALEPLAQSMATLATETRQTLADIDHASRQQAERSIKQISAAAAAAQRAAAALDQAGRRLEIRHYLLASLTGALAAALASALWIWLSPPPVVQTSLDAQAVAQYLAQALHR